MKKPTMKIFWNKVGDNYQDSWNGLAKRATSDRELMIINGYLQKTSPKNILDIGIGNGRILSLLIKESLKNSKVSGIDISDSMVKYCQKYL